MTPFLKVFRRPRTISCTATKVYTLDCPLQLELQCHELSSEKQESYVENVKLKMTNDELSRALETTSQELALAQDQLSMLQDQAARLHQEKEMWGRRTGALQRCRFVNNQLTDMFCVCSQGDVQSDGGAAAREAKSHEAA